MIDKWLQEIHKIYSMQELVSIAFQSHCKICRFAHLDFKDSDGYNKALQLNKSAIGNFWLSVEKAKPRIRRDSHGIGGGRGGYHGGRDGEDYGGRTGWGRSHGAGRHWTANTEHW
jgi:hypothetical protein